MTPAKSATAPVDLLALAIAEPDRAQTLADELLAESREPSELSIAHQSRGIVARDRGRTGEALAELRTSLRLARRSGHRDREADVRATLGVTLVVAGRTRSGLEELQRAVEQALDPTLLAKVRMRRAHVRYFFLRSPLDALADLRPALQRFRQVDEPVWLARTLNLVGLAELALGSTDVATAAVTEAEGLFRSEGQLAESLVSLHSRAAIAFCSGDLPRALALYDEAVRAHELRGLDTAGLLFDQCEALVAAGLIADAAALLAARLSHGHLSDAQRGDLALRRATIELAGVDRAACRAAAMEACSLFRRQRRPAWAARADLVVLLTEPPGRKHLVQRARAVARLLEAPAPEEAVIAWLLAGRLALDLKVTEADDLLARAAAYRTHSSDLVRATAWHAEALRRGAGGNVGGVLLACRRGLRALDDHRSTLGSSELRALAMRHGDDLARLALRQALERGPRTLLEWSERWRATALTQPPVRPPDDEELARDLAALRDTRRRLSEAKAAGSSSIARLDEDRARLERAVRRRTHHLAGNRTETTRFEAERLVAALNGATFVELVDIDGTLHALVARTGRVRHCVVGSTADAEQAATFARFALRQAARGRPADLDDVGRRLQEALLGDAVRRLGDGSVVLSPPGRLHATPWTLAPALADVAVSVVPSAALWLRATASAPSAGRRVLIAGPGLESGGAELDTLAERHPDAILLRAGSATVESSLEALDGAAIAHVAAHGHFRDDSPMFSSLDLDDGQLTVHDFERLEHAPHRVVLSACESGVVAPIGAGEMLGLVSAMLAMGSAGIVSSVATVNDRATAALMLEVHAALDDGLGLGEVLLRARQAGRGDRLHEATAAAFQAMGA